LQPLYNLYDRSEYEGDLADVCILQGIGVITYFSLAAGFLTGKYRSEADFSKSPRGAGMKKYMNERGMRILEALDDVGASLQATPAQVALAWLMQRPGVTAPIASATSVAQLQELIGAARLVLGANAIERLDDASA
jgi:aryl-alcohol dehydrogenase-like predicted oxidoreductase